MANSKQDKTVQAVVISGGKQYLVRPGSVIKVDKIAGAVGEVVTFADLPFAVTADGVAKPAALKKVQVTAEITEQGKGEKIHVITYKSKKRVRRHLGHRSLLSTLKITGIGTAA